MVVRSSREAWDSGRPIWHRLPAKGYKDNPTADALTLWTDEKLIAVKDILEAWYLELHPDTCQDVSLDYLAFLVGFSGKYWDTRWSPTVKRELIRLSHSFIWSHKGTLAVIEKILDIHGIEHLTWTDTVLTLSFKMPATFGSAGLRLYLRLPLSTQRSSEEWKEAQRTLDLYAPAVIENRVCHKYFYLGFDVLGDPMFSVD